jgi:hypothetical protein
MKTKLEEIFAAHVIDGALVVPRKKIKVVNEWTHQVGEKNLLPNMKQVVNFFSLVAEWFLIEGDKEKAITLFDLIMRYSVAEATKYYRDESGYSWSFHKSFFETGSPCCNCDIKSYMSDWACKNGLANLGKSAVWYQCPASPPGYSPQASTSGPRSEEEQAKRNEWTKELVERWDGVGYDYFWESYGVFMGA